VPFTECNHKTTLFYKTCIPLYPPTVIDRFCQTGFWLPPTSHSALPGEDLFLNLPSWTQFTPPDSKALVVVSGPRVSVVVPIGLEHEEANRVKLKL